MRHHPDTRLADSRRESADTTFGAFPSPVRPAAHDLPLSPSAVLVQQLMPQAFHQQLDQSLGRVPAHRLQTPNAAHIPSDGPDLDATVCRSPVSMCASALAYTRQRSHFFPANQPRDALLVLTDLPRDPASTFDKFCFSVCLPLCTHERSCRSAFGLR